MKTQTFGIEIEMTGISREKTANKVAEYFGTTARHIGGGYDTYEVKMQDGRVWKIVNDASITAERRHRIPADDTYKVELVSPICKYEDIETVQEIVRRLRGAGMIANQSTGIHYQK